MHYELVNFLFFRLLSVIRFSVPVQIFENYADHILVINTFMIYQFGSTLLIFTNENRFKAHHTLKIISIKNSAPPKEHFDTDSY